jgi:hypothetical protein
LSGAPGRRPTTNKSALCVRVSEFHSGNFIRPAQGTSAVTNPRQDLDPIQSRARCDAASRNLAPGMQDSFCDVRKPSPSRLIQTRHRIAIEAVLAEFGDQPTPRAPAGRHRQGEGRRRLETAPVQFDARRGAGISAARRGALILAVGSTSARRSRSIGALAPPCASSLSVAIRALQETLLLQAGFQAVPPCPRITFRRPRQRYSHLRGRVSTAKLGMSASTTQSALRPPAPASLVGITNAWAISATRIPARSSQGQRTLALEAVPAPAR